MTGDDPGTDDPGAEAESVPDRFEAYVAGYESPRFTDWLRERSPAWSAATDHRFTRELRAGTLDEAVFERYLLQDDAFVETLAGAFGHAVGEAPTMDAKARLTDFLGTLTAEENDYFERSFEALGASRPAAGDRELTPTTRALQDLLERAAREGGYAETLAVLVPAEWIYLAWATAGDGDRPAPFYHAEWIDLHANDEFASFVAWLRAELDREGRAAAPRRRRRLRRLFDRTVELEAAFFEAAYEPGAAGAHGLASGDGADGGDQRW